MLQRISSVFCCVRLDKELFELADEVDVFWKELALDLGLTGDELDFIEKEATTTRDRAFKMLRHLLAKMSANSVFNVDDIRTRLMKIKEKQYDAQLKSNTTNTAFSRFFFFFFLLRYLLC
jgi:uncharacterized protein YbjQ (UPF0145 family)